MGQTLTHGVYLPDEGERNCYNGLAANWQLLDTSVGTITEHISQIAGKAPLVHTHTKSDITDFPALATVATSGSYNDLSNIPASFTPASHSHGNITNDGKVGTAENKPLITGTDGVVQAGAFGNAANTFCEGNDSRLSDARTPVAHTHTKSDVTDLLNSNFIPSANNSYDLGSSSYQWNNLYAKNHYYNGVAWGLDKANTWSQSQTIKNTEYQIGETPSAAKAVYINFTDKNNVNIGWIQRRIEASGDSSIELFVYNRFTNSQPDPAGTTDYAMLKVGLKSDQTHFCEITGDAYPRNNNAYNLGTSSKKWKTLNGTNPGALSLPDDSSSVSIDTTNWNVSGGFGNAYTPASDGWLHINIKDTATNSIFVFATNKYSASVYGNGSQGLAGRLALMMPVLSGVTYAIIITAGSVSEIYTAKFFPCKGNV